MKYLALLSLFMCSVMVSGQSAKTDSLIKMAGSSKDDTNKVNTLYQLSEICEERDILKYSLPALELAKKLNYKKGIAANLNNIGYYYYFVLNDPEKALDNYNRSLILSRETGNLTSEAVTLFNLGLVYKNSALAEKALDCFSEASKIREKIGDTLGIAKILNYTGNVYDLLNMDDEALNCYLKAYELQKMINDVASIPFTLSNVGRLFERKQKNDKAEEYYLKAIACLNSLAPSQVNKKTLANILFQMGGLYMQKGLNDKALQNLNAALTINTEINDQRAIAYCYIGLANLQYRMHNSEKAIAFLQKALAMGSELKVPGIICDATERLSIIYENNGDFEKAFKMHKLYKQCSDSINILNARDAVLKKQIQYHFTEKEEELRSAYEKEKTEAAHEKNMLRLTVLSLAVLFVLVVIIGAMVFRQNKLKAQFQSVQLEQKLLRSQMNPHFIYNCLQSIQNFIHDKKAERYLSSFGALARSVLENSRLEAIPLYKEIELLEHYLQLQKLLYEDQFEYKLIVSSDLDIDNISIPPMISQPFIENAIEHGFRSIEKGGLLLISFSLMNDMLQLEIKDNGTGMQSDINKQHQSMATYITKERIALLNKRKKDKTSFSITEAYPDQVNKGVKVTFTIPLK